MEAHKKRERKILVGPLKAFSSANKKETSSMKESLSQRPSSCRKYEDEDRHKIAQFKSAEMNGNDHHQRENNLKRPKSVAETQSYFSGKDVEIQDKWKQSPNHLLQKHLADSSVLRKDSFDVRTNIEMESSLKPELQNVKQLSKKIAQFRVSENEDTSGKQEHLNNSTNRAKSAVENGLSVRKHIVRDINKDIHHKYEEKLIKCPIFPIRPKSELKLKTQQVEVPKLARSELKLKDLHLVEHSEPLEQRDSVKKREPVDRPRSKSASKQQPLKAVRRKLNFQNKEGTDELEPPSVDIDFTDKIAAIRSLVIRDRITPDITNRKAYYDGYRSSHKKVLVRNDSLKENKLNNDDFDCNIDSNDIEMSLQNGHNMNCVEKLKTRKGKVDENLMEINVLLLKEQLEERHREKDGILRKRNNHCESAKIYSEFKCKEDSAGIDSEGLVHAEVGRRILQSSKQQELDDEQCSESFVAHIQNSLLESKETQTNVLNSSIRSVQSNVPFYDPSRRPVSAPLFHGEFTHKIHLINTRTRKMIETTDNGVNLQKGIKSSPGQANKQTNVDSFTGASYNVEQGKLTQMVNNECNDMDLDIQVNIDQSKVNLRHRSGNLRPSSGNSKLGNRIVNSHKIHSANVVNGNCSVIEKELLTNKDLAKKSVGDRKVREWIKYQEKLATKRKESDTGQMFEEVNVSINSNSSPANMLISPTSSEDRTPINVEATKNAFTQKFKTNSTNNVGLNQANVKSVACSPNRQTIFDRLQKISDVAIKGQQRLDIVQLAMEQQNGCMINGQPESSDSTDAESSVFSLPFSVQSGESVSTTIQAVKLLRKLYHVDADKRQNLVLMAKCFRRWFNNVLHAKARNVEITQAASRMSPISYGVMLHKSDICYRDTVLSRYFDTWKIALRNAQLAQEVMQLNRRHLLRKGMNAFKWAINRSKLQQGILQDRINGILIQSYFVKWKRRALENRQLRLQQAFFRWRQFTKEAQKIRMLRNQTNTRLKERIFLVWHDNYQTRLKEHKAETHMRTVLMSHGWLSWKLYTALSKERKQRQKMAMQLLQVTLQKKMFTSMKVEFIKYSKAKQFYRLSQIKIALTSWRIGAQLCKTDCDQDIRVADIHWSHNALRSNFTAWRDAVLTKRACRLYDNNLTRNAFTLWHIRYQHLVQRRAAADTFVHHTVTSRAFRHWWTFVTDMKMCRMEAIRRLESVLQGHMFDLWHWYTKYQRDLRKRFKLYVWKHDLDTQRLYLSIWRTQFSVKCDVKKAQQLWSNTCARQAADQWRQVCHKRRLGRLLIDSEPVRQLQNQNVFFEKWKTRLALIVQEKQAAAQVRAMLDLSLLCQLFKKWRDMTKQLLLIKPKVLQYKTALVSECFIEWRQYVMHKAFCMRSEKSMLTIRLRHKFKAWRRHYLVHQIEKDISKKLLSLQTRRGFEAWRLIIQCKHAAQDLHKRYLVKTMFYHWHTLALRQLREKRLQKVELESVMNTLKESFNFWRQKLCKQQAQEEENVTSIQVQQQNNCVKVAFFFWRRHFRSTLVARENEKIRIRKIARQTLQAWHSFTRTSMSEAVHKFAAAIGLNLYDSEPYNQQTDTTDDRGDDDSQGKDDGHFEPMNFESNMTPYSFASPRTPRTPKKGSSLGTPLKRLYSPTLSRQSLTQSLEFTTGGLTSPSFLDARFEMEHAVKTESRREIIETVVNRLRHWPVSVMFDQWKEYTARQREFKLLSAQLVSLHEKLELKTRFNAWAQHHRDMKLAKQHYEQVLQHKALLTLILYRNSRKEKANLNTIARTHFTIKVFTRVFPMWHVKAQEKQHAERIVHLWTNITDQERELIPRERSFRYQLNKKNMKECFNLWMLKYHRVSKLKKVHHKILLDRYFVSWCNWALDKHERRVKCEEFSNRRLQILAFKTWSLRHTRTAEVENRYKDAWSNYLSVIVKSWKQWTSEQAKRKVIGVQVLASTESHLVTRAFATWKTESAKLLRVKKWHDRKLVFRVLYAWQEVTLWQKDMQQRKHKCQLITYTVLAKRSFQMWHGGYLRRLQLHELHENIVNRRVLNIATRWRRKAQTTRGRQLRKHFQTQQMHRTLTKWRAAYSRILERYNKLDVYLVRKNHLLMSQHLQEWHSELMCLQAARVFNMKLVSTLITNWKLAAKGCRYRRESLQVHVNKKHWHTQQGYFLYWFNVAKARKSIRGHANLKIQLTVFKTWLVYTRKQINLRRLLSAFTKKRNLCILNQHWYLMKTRFDYCTELSEIANRVVQEKNLALMKQALCHWDLRLKIVIADECHEHILAKRAAGRWHKFVLHKRQERQHMLELMEKATQFYQKKLCNKVYQRLFNEVLATRQDKKRKLRLCVRYGQSWKRKTDMSFTAKSVYVENTVNRAWKKWHMEFIRQKTIQKVKAFEKKQQLTLVFVSWKNLCTSKSRKMSLIPLPVSPACNMPSAGGSR